MSRRSIIRLHPDTFYLITYDSPIIGKNRMVANKIYADRLDTDTIEIIGFSDRVGGDRYDAHPKHMKQGMLVIGKTRHGMAYLGKDPKDHSTLKIKQVFKED